MNHAVGISLAWLSFFKGLKFMLHLALEEIISWTGKFYRQEHCVPEKLSGYLRSYNRQRVGGYKAHTSYCPPLAQGRTEPPASQSMFPVDLCAITLNVFIVRDNLKYFQNHLFCLIASVN